MSDTGGKHRKRLPSGSRHRGRATTPSGQRRRPVLRAGAVVAAAGLGSGLLGAAPTTTPATGPLATAHRNVVLTDYTGTTSPTPTFDDSLKWLLDSLGIGTKTLPNLLPSGATIGGLLSPSGLDVSTPLTPTGLFDLLGLNNFTLGDILTDLGLNPTMTMDAFAQKIQMANVPVDFFATPLGAPSTQTTLGLAERFDIANYSLDKILSLAGTQNGVTMSGSTTLSQALTFMNLQGTYLNTLIGLGTLVGNMTCPTAVSGSMTMDQFINCFTYDGTIPNNGASTHGSVHLTGSTTVYQLLTQEHFYATTAAGNNTTSHTTELIGDWTIGQILNFNSTTTIQQFIDNLHVNLNVHSDTYPLPPATVGPGAPSGSTTGVSISDSSADKGSATLPIPSGTPSDGSAGGGPDVTTLPTLGSQTLGAFLTWINLNPNQTLAQLLGEVMIGSNPLSSSTIGSALTTMLLNPGALGPVGSQVVDTTPLETFFTAMGGPLATDTIDELLHLS